jgi:hypothetical protein
MPKPNIGDYDPAELNRAVRDAAILSDEDYDGLSYKDKAYSGNIGSLGNSSNTSQGNSMSLPPLKPLPALKPLPPPTLKPLPPPTLKPLPPTKKGGKLRSKSIRRTKYVRKNSKSTNRAKSRRTRRQCK